MWLSHNEIIQFKCHASDSHTAENEMLQSTMCSIRKNHCGRSTHVIYQFFIIPCIRYNVLEIILLLLNNFFSLKLVLEQLKQHQIKISTSSIEEITRYFYRYHKTLVKKWLDYFYVRHKKKYLYITLNYRDIVRRNGLFARFWIVKHYKCQHMPWRFRMSELTDLN